MMDICGYEYHPDGVCAYQIRFDLIDGVVRNAKSAEAAMADTRGFPIW